MVRIRRLDVHCKEMGQRRTAGVDGGTRGAWSGPTPAIRRRRQLWARPQNPNRDPVLSPHVHSKPWLSRSPAWLSVWMSGDVLPRSQVGGGVGGQINQSFPSSPTLSPSQPCLVLRDTQCSCEAYGMRPTNKGGTAVTRAAGPQRKQGPSGTHDADSHATHEHHTVSTDGAMPITRASEGCIGGRMTGHNSVPLD